jgi:hypothetical protein
MQVQSILFDRHLHSLGEFEHSKYYRRRRVFQKNLLPFVNGTEVDKNREALKKLIPFVEF